LMYLCRHIVGVCHDIFAPQILWKKRQSLIKLAGMLNVGEH
jgi:hypothetical protein